MNNNRTDENAILGKCKGVFSKTSYITIGTKEHPEAYGSKDSPRSCYAGKQFEVTSTKKGKNPGTYFAKKHEWISEGDKFVDRTRYSEVQTTKPKGFLTSDFHRRDEFSNSIRTEQWREQLKTENKFAKTVLDAVDCEISTDQPSSRDENDFLYDRVFEKDRGSDSRRVWGGGSERRTTYALTHLAPENFEKPKYGRKPVIRDTFYRKMNIPLSTE